MHEKIHQLDSASAALAALCDGFFADLHWLQTCREIGADRLPQAARDLLAHEHHMTTTLRDYYEQPIDLDVLDYRQDGDQYRRKIVLTIDEGRQVVEFGVVRLDLRFLSPGARTAILERQTPLGDIFGQHRVLTRVQPLWYLRFAPECPVVEYFHPPTTGPVYGRIGMIHCDGRPALELLEVVRAADLG